MKLQHSTGILLGVATVLVATVTLVETQKGSQTHKGNTLYDFAEADVGSFTIDLEDRTLAFSKIDDTWQMTKPESTEADPSSIAFLLNILTSSIIEETITTTPDRLEAYGLDAPVATVNLQVDEANYTLIVGDEDFSGAALYVMPSKNNDESTQSIDIHLISNELENGLERPLEDWKAKE
ncbi:MAG: DUF4340 domain-containing protein [Leptolyngbya sp. SIO3F4]|nr:DUF4340 domain-containing protein [Leptolyngbya sp. SIO3F4]